jgi:hypothetical protein
MIHRDGWEGPRIEQNPATYAWFYWDRSYHGDIVMRRIWGRERDQPYDGEADFSGSINDAYAAIRQRVADGGPGWTAKPPESPDPPPQPAPAAPAAELDDGIPDFLRRKAS